MPTTLGCMPDTVAGAAGGEFGFEGHGHRGLVGGARFPEDLKRWLGAESSIAKQASADALAESVARKVASSALALGLQLNQRRGKPKGLER